MLSTLGWLGACSCLMFCWSSHIQALRSPSAQPTQPRRRALSCQQPRPAVSCPQAHAQRVQQHRRVDAGWRPALLRDGPAGFPSFRAPSFGPARACCPLLPHHRVPCLLPGYLPACLPCRASSAPSPPPARLPSYLQALEPQRGARLDGPLQGAHKQGAVVQRLQVQEAGDAVQVLCVCVCVCPDTHTRVWKGGGSSGGMRWEAGGRDGRSGRELHPHAPAWSPLAHRTPSSAAACR